MGYTESTIIEQLKAGDSKIFEWLFKEYYSPLCIYAHRFVGETETAKEIVAATYAAIWEGRDQIVFGQSVKGYIFRTVHNKCINHLKQLSVRKRYEQYLLNSLTESSEGTGADELLAGDLQRAISQAIDQLPEKCRAIFLLSRMQHKKYQEIAAHLDISVKTVETQMSIALRRLRHHLQPWIPLIFMLHFCA